MRAEQIGLLDLAMPIILRLGARVSDDELMRFSKQNDSGAKLAWLVDLSRRTCRSTAQTRRFETFDQPKSVTAE